MSCPIAEALKDPLTYYKKMSRNTDHPLDTILSEELPEGKLICNGTGGTPDWHRHMENHGPRSEAYAAYNFVMSSSGEVINV